LQQGDVILSADGRQIKTVHDLPRIVAATPPGHTLKMEVLRNGNQQQIAATIGQMPENPQVAEAGGGPGKEATSLGLQLSSITPDLRHKYHIPNSVAGVVVTEIAPNSPAATLGIQPGDVIMSIDRQPARAPDQAAAELKQAASKGNILLLLNRKGTSQFVGLSVSPGGVGNGSPG
jgi:serine protease Do